MATATAFLANASLPEADKVKVSHHGAAISAGYALSVSNFLHCGADS
ncbi:hypothetical protein [Saccharopolyspora hattusasensis]